MSFTNPWDPQKSSMIAMACVVRGMFDQSTVFSNRPGWKGAVLTVCPDYPAAKELYAGSGHGPAVINSHPGAAPPEHGGRMAVGNCGDGGKTQKGRLQNKGKNRNVQ